MKLFEVRDITPDSCGGELFSYLVWCIKNPDKGSLFDGATEHLRGLSDTALMQLLIKMDYGGFVFTNDDGNEVIGHVFFQRRGDTLHIFSITTRREFRCSGIGKNMVREVLVRVYDDVGVNRVRIGAGGHPAVDKLWRRVIEGRLGLPFEVKGDGEIGFARFVR